jgi:hypothetical protein
MTIYIEHKIKNLLTFIKNSIITAKGDLIVGKSSGVPDILPVGAHGDDEVLTLASGETLGMKWAALTHPFYHIADYDQKYRFTSFAAGTNIFHGHDAVAGSSGTSYAKMKTITLGILPDASLIIYFELAVSTSGYVYAQIYRKGVAVGTERSTNSTSYVAYTETIVGWSVDDTLELWAHGTGMNNYAVRNFRILGTAVKISNS